MFLQVVPRILLHREVIAADANPITFGIAVRIIKYLTLNLSDVICMLFDFPDFHGFASSGFTVHSMLLVELAFNHLDDLLVGRVKDDLRHCLVGSNSPKPCHIDRVRSNP